METTVQLNNSLTFLAYATGIIILIVGDLSKLTRNVDETVTIAKTELEPTLKNINKSVEILSGVIIKTDSNIKKIKNFLSKTPLKLLGNLSKLSSRASRGFWSGLSAAMKMFSNITYNAIVVKNAVNMNIPAK